MYFHLDESDVRDFDDFKHYLNMFSVLFGSDLLEVFKFFEGKGLLVVYLKHLVGSNCVNSFSSPDEAGMVLPSKSYFLSDEWIYPVFAKIASISWLQNSFFRSRDYVSPVELYELYKWLKNDVYSAKMELVEDVKRFANEYSVGDVDSLIDVILNRSCNVYEK